MAMSFQWDDWKIEWKPARPNGYGGCFPWRFHVGPILLMGHPEWKDGMRKK